MDDGLSDLMRNAELYSACAISPRRSKRGKANLSSLVQITSGGIW